MADNAESMLSTATDARLPTVSASQMLKDLGPLFEDLIPFGLPTLDASLQNAGAGRTGDQRIGLTANRVTEMYGPPGAGKTSLCMQAASNCLVQGGNVVWIDASSIIVAPRLDRFVRASIARVKAADLETQLTVSDLMTKFTHFQTPTLAHLLALLIHPEGSLLPADTRLIVFDSLDTLLETAYPRSIEPRPGPKGSDRTAAGGRKRNILAQISSRIRTLATMKNASVLVTNGVVTKVSGGSMAFLRPSIAGSDWEDMLHSRIVLFRDWSQDQSGQVSECSRFARILKSRGESRSPQQIISETVAFEIGNHGVRELPNEHVASADNTTYSNKRPYSDVEGGDESDQDYGWVEDEIQLAAEGLVDESDLTKPAFTSARISHDPGADT